VQALWMANRRRAIAAVHAHHHDRVVGRCIPVDLVVRRRAGRESSSPGRFRLGSSSSMWVSAASMVGRRRRQVALPDLRPRRMLCPTAGERSGAGKSGGMRSSRRCVSWSARTWRSWRWILRRRSRLRSRVITTRWCRGARCSPGRRGALSRSWRSRLLSGRGSPGWCWRASGQAPVGAAGGDRAGEANL